MEGGDQPQLFAVFVLADVGDAEAGEVGILGGEAGGGGLAAGVGVGAGVEHDDLEGGVGDQQPGEGAEADVVHGPVTADGDDRGQQGEFFLGVQFPIEGAEVVFVEFRIVMVLEVELGGAQGAEVFDGAGAQALEQPLGHGHGVLKQAVDPGVGVGVVGEGGGVDAAATGGVGNDRAGRSAAGGATLEAVEARLEPVDGPSHPLQSPWVMVVVGHGVELGGEALDQVFQLPDMGPAPFFVDGPVGGHEHA